MKGIVAGNRIVYEPPTGRELFGSVEQGETGGRQDWGCSTSQCHPGLKDHEASWGPERPKATSSVFCRSGQPSLLFPPESLCSNLPAEFRRVRYSDSVLCLAGQGSFSTASVWYKEHYTYNEPKKILLHNAPLFVIFTETMTRRCRAHVTLSLKSHFIVCKQ